MALLSIYDSKKDTYRNQHVVITGGSLGIGLALAYEYLDAGANITLLARDIDRLKLVKQQLEKYILTQSQGYLVQQIQVFSLDISNSYEVISTVIKQAEDTMNQPISVLVNCAGISIAGEFDKLPIEEFERMMRVNYLGSIYVTRAALESIKRYASNSANKGRIIFVSSQVAQAAIHGYTAYGGSKWALRGVAEALQMEVRPYNIIVSVGYPPDTDTDGYREEMKTKPLITQQLSESGNVFTSQQVAKSLIHGSTVGLFTISIGLDGWLLKQVHPGMTPVNNWFETIQQIFFCGIARFIALFYILTWDRMIFNYVKSEKKESKEK